jgi:hypothetical protein
LQQLVGDLLPELLGFADGSRHLSGQPLSAIGAEYDRVEDQLFGIAARPGADRCQASAAQG